MQPLAEPVSNLIEAFTQLPGIGPKTATRLTYFLLRSDESVALRLARALEELKQRTLFCSVCFNIADQDPCSICANPQRDHGLICVVEEPLDVQAIERTREFNGVYHVLHGAISPVEGIGPEDLKIGELLHRIQTNETPVRELLLATNPNLEGEATAMYIARLIKPLGVRVTRLARGLPVGGDLEYADEVTLGRALAGRSEM
ncbi:recombination mediator RecR [Caldilinea sp.]|jgi:recombination protein RecR|uniref:recombination mediator RecR n=1 Tax=Caldilinea sp. TaxID=2293560 RepID=UPI002613190F|nr:recombination mediator RecR [uncultured Caldilinea sp.]